VLALRSWIRTWTYTAVVMALLAVMVEISPRSAAAAGVGFRDFSYGSGVTAPTGQKPQSKLWFTDGSWWGALYSTSSSAYTIHRLSSSQTWSNTGVAIDDRERGRPDALWSGGKLFIVSGGTSPSSSGDSARLLRYSYDATTDTYSLDAGFPVVISSGGMDSAVLDRDSTGILWVTYTQNGRVLITHSTGDDRVWVAPYVIPVGGATGTLTEDISAVVAFNNKIGVMWSNQSDWSFYFAVHVDGAPDDQWQRLIAHQAPEESDNHINLRSLQADPSGQVYAAVKTSLNSSSAPLNLLLRLKPDLTWTSHVFGRVSDNHTRPNVLIDSENRQVYMFASAPCCSGGTIYYKQSSLDNISFPPGLGTPFIQSSTDPKINNVTTTKQELNGTTDLVLMAGDDSTRFYLHNHIDLPSGGDNAPPETSIDSGPSGTVTATDAVFAFSSSEAGSNFQCRLDGAAFSPCTSPHSYTNLLPGARTFEVRAIDAAGNADPTPAGRTWTIDGGTTSPITFQAEADAWVEQANPALNHGTTAAVEVDTSPRTDGYVRFAVSGMSGSVQSAKLRLFAFGATSNGPAAYTSDSSWTETGLNWSNRPAIGAVPLEDKGSIPINTWVEYDVTQAVTGNGTYSFALIGTSSDGVDFRSREAPTDRPQLIVTGGGGPTPPDTSLTSGPSGTVNTPSSVFTFSATETGSTFECKLDTGTFAPCTSPFTTPALGDGSHTFEVRATDPTGDTDQTPAARTWMVDTTAPETTITSGPSGTLGTAAASFTFSSSEPGSAFECRIDAAPFAACTSPKAFSALANGSHTFEVRAIDAAGNADPSPASRTWTVLVTGTTFTFGAEADAWVEQSVPTANHGTTASIEVDQSPRTDGYIRFVVTGLSGAVQSARLRVFAFGGSSNGPAVHGASNSWTETGIQFGNRPLPSAGPFDDKAAIAANTWVEFDVSAFVTGNGTFTFVVLGTSGDGTDFRSREATANRPELVVTVGAP
jgi:hypothetical protein